MKEKLINDFVNYLQKSRIKNIRISANNNKVSITTSLLNYKILVDLGLISLATYGTYTVADKNFYLIPIISVYIILGIIIWVDYNSINTIRIDFFAKTLEVNARNIVQRIIRKYVLRKKYQYEFKDIGSFTVRSNDSFKSDLIRYYVYLKLNDNSKLLLISFQDESASLTFSNFLTSLVRNQTFS